MAATMPRLITKIPANPLLSKANDEFKQIRVAAYCRVSTDSEDQLQSYKAQVAYSVTETSYHVFVSLST